MRSNCCKRGISALVLLLTVLPAQAATIEVTIEKLVFEPASISATVGDTIRWVNKDVMAHTATAAGGFDISIPPRQSKSIVVTKAGAVDYYCRFHPNMRGKIDIQAQ